MTEILGVDPSQRHTGLCLLKGMEPLFFEIKTEGDVLSSARQVRAGFKDFLQKHQVQKPALCIERQLVIGGQSAPLMFFFQMNLLEVVKQHWVSPDQLVMPLPNQLQSYIYHRHGLKPSKAATPVVNLYKKLTGDTRRVSIHCVDAYFLACMGREVLAKTWKYKLPENEPPQHPWRIHHGE